MEMMKLKITIYLLFLFVLTVNGQETIKKIEITDFYLESMSLENLSKDHFSNCSSNIKLRSTKNIIDNDSIYSLKFPRTWDIQENI
jgi:hypothetical protein